MLKFLPSPSIKFVNDLLAHLESTDAESGYTRVLVHPVTDGLRMRNLDMTLRVSLEVCGCIVNATWEEAVNCNELQMPYMKTQPFAITDLLVMAEKIEGFFKREWEIEKDA